VHVFLNGACVFLARHHCCWKSIFGKTPPIVRDLRTTCVECRQRSSNLY